MRGSLPAARRSWPEGDSRLFGLVQARRLASVTRASGIGWIAALATSQLGCGDELRPPSHIETTEILTIRHEVQIGPLKSNR